MLQIVGLLAISWLIVWLFEQKSLSVLGLTPSGDRLKYFALLFFVSAILAAGGFLLRMYFAKEEYAFSPSLTTSSVLLETWYQLRSVLTEELLCRGVLLYLLIRKLGVSRAIVISAFVFALLHWMGGGNVIQLALLFVFTFAMGLLLAYAYARTYSLLIPLAIHFGWNLTQNYIFPDTASGNHVFTLAAPPPTVTISYLAFFTMLLLPKVSVLLTNFLILKKHRQADIP